MRSFLAASLAALAASPLALAGYTATTGVDPVSTPSGPLAGPQVGDAFATTTPGTFTSFVGDTPADAQVTGGDLNFYRYTLSGAVTGVDLLLGRVDYAGTYTIFYDGNLDGAEGGPADPRVSRGTFTITALFTPGTNNAVLTGLLTQTSGPAVAAFRDLSYGGNGVEYTGAYVGTNPGVSGFIQGALRQNAVVPAPAAGALAGAGLLAGLRRRRRGG